MESITREEIKAQFPYGAVYVPSPERAMVLSPFEFDEDDDDLSALAWAHPNKSFRFDFSEGVVKGDGWEFPDEIDKSVFIRPASESAWKKLKPTLED